METAIIVAIIGAVATVGGLAVSGFFGLLGQTNERERAAQAGVEKAQAERLAYRDEQLKDCRRELEECETARKEDHQTISSQSTEIWALKQENYRLTLELEMLKEKKDKKP